MKQAARFHKLFLGLERAYGTFAITGKDSGKNKMVGKALTVEAPVKTSLWKEHIEGTKSLGIVAITEDNTSNFSAIDIDIYPLDHQALENNIKKNKLPLIICKTKSGGAHLYLFLSEPVETRLVTEKMKSWAKLLGHPGVEVFPKQDKITKKDQGNWINMPYFGDTRRCFHDGEELSHEHFLDLAESVMINEETLLDFGSGPTQLKGAPPCLIELSDVGIPNGNRNNTLFSYAVYCKKRYADNPDDILPKLKEINKLYFSPPLSDSEVKACLASASKKDYMYRCKQEPLCNVCDKKECKKVRYGVGKSNKPLHMRDLIQYMADPAYFELNISGVMVRIDNADVLLSIQKLRGYALSAGVFVPAISQLEWNITLEELYKDVEHRPAPVSVEESGRIKNYIEDYCEHRPTLRMEEDYLKGAWKKVDELVTFNLVHFLDYMRQNLGRSYTDTQITAILGRMSSKFENVTLLKKQVQLVSVDGIVLQEEFSKINLDVEDDF